ncbi:MAG: Ribonuclease 3 [Candidatus Daviesbacteria bacterium GW2011_GWA2_38_24]|uniref:Ribonuclease 3 n=1 Tax=Candidatus Daviesbacteria bacterium GW2011_GWA2_38_24 TaxID=1618422 RepID=A0A0G0JI45_9BACT|nr:MAG: Ribonuclease 3 [Candidatus Daviesbacteria bacterium GW2011_GWA2_38_24]KKQ79615.1 MAG: Ribonuclease 3 [Candidatus Daviesbacteria bacterium GW2011_GWA1_38_7]
MQIDEKLLTKPIYQKAFTHRSYLNEVPEVKESNERLEFLGDSVLSLLISEKLYELRPQDSEGALTNLRSYIVKTISLAKAARELNLGKYLRLSKGEELSGGRENTQLLANTYEALLGAVFLDQGIDATKQFVEQTLLPLFQEELKYGPPKDAKSRLQEVLQDEYKKSPQYRILKTTGPDHARSFTVGVFLDREQLGTGEGMSKQLAEEAAALDALAKITFT